MPGLWISIVSFLTFLLVHWIVWRSTEPQSRGVNLIFIIGCTSFALVNGLVWWQWGQEFALNFGGIAAAFYLLWMVGYIHWYAGMDRSLSVRILGELSGTKQNSMTHRELAEVYPTREMVHHRIRLLEEKKWIESRENAYHCLDTGKKMAKVTMFFHKVFKLKVTG